MKNKNIYMILGGIIILGTIFYFYNKNKNKKTDASTDADSDKVDNKLDDKPVDKSDIKDNNKDKTTIENAIKILGFYKGDFDKKQEQEFIALYRQNINTDLHKKLFKALTKLKQNSMEGGGFTELTAEEKDAIKYLYDNVIKIIKGTIKPKTDVRPKGCPSKELMARSKYTKEGMDKLKALGCLN